MKQIIIYILPVILLSCGQKDNRCIVDSPDKISSYGVDFNNERQRIGLPIFETKWQEDSIHYYKGVCWTIANNKHHFQKYLEFTCDSLIAETDEYRDNVFWSGLNGEKLVSISISYYFNKNKSPIKTNGFVCRIDTVDPRKDLPDSSFISLQQAETYLLNWGVKRLE